MPVRNSADGFGVFDRIVDGPDEIVRQLDHLALRNLALRDDGNLAHPLNSWKTSAPQCAARSPASTTK